MKWGESEGELNLNELNVNIEKLPHGTVFASFMVSIMMGSWFYSKWISQASHGGISLSIR